MGRTTSSAAPRDERFASARTESMPAPRQRPVTSPEAALERLLSAARPVVEVERIGILTALARVLAEAQYSTLQVPPSDNSAMDGYVVFAEDIPSESEARLPVVQRIPAGKSGGPLRRGTAARIFTGGPIPAGGNAVVMQERCRLEDGQVSHPADRSRRVITFVVPGKTSPGASEFSKSARASGPRTWGWRHRWGWRSCRSSARFGSRSSPRATSCANPVSASPTARSTTPIATRCTHPWRRSAARCWTSASCRTATRRPAVPYHLARTARTSSLPPVGCRSVKRTMCAWRYKRSASSTSGASPSSRASPWHSGTLVRRPFSGCRANPVAAFVTFCLFARPFILRLQGVEDVMPIPTRVPVLSAYATRPSKRCEYIRARLERDGDGGTGVAIYPHQGSGVLSSTSWANGLARIPADAVIERGTLVEFLPFIELLN